MLAANRSNYYQYDSDLRNIYAGHLLILIIKTMQSHYAEQFDREMGCTETEWLGWLPAAMGDVPWQHKPSSAHAQLGAGRLDIFWQSGEPRRIALFKIPRLLVRFRFEGLDDAQRYAFMKRFDLYMQRGGG